uniref:Cupin type-2 domain-containing protein n=1 Tax=Amphimedon queenslandica TaxID=400682 RepID=A0A1X7T2Q1_AMPQE
HTSSPSPPPPPVTTTRPSTRNASRSTNNSRHTTTTSSPPPPQPPPTSRASTRTTVTNSKPSTARKDTPPLIIDSIQDVASPSKAAPIDQLPNASPLKTVVKSRRKRKKITCPPPRRRQPTKRTITEITRRTDLTPGVRRSNRPNIKRVPIGGYVEYKDHWGNTPSNTYVFPLSHGQLCNVDGMDLQPGDDLIINRVMGTDDYQKGEMELKKGSEKPMAQNGNCEMVFRVLKGKVLAVLEDQEVEVGTDEYVLIPPGTAYQLNNVSRSNTIIDYTCCNIAYPLNL